MNAHFPTAGRSMRARARANAALGHVILTASRCCEIELLGGVAEFRVEVEFYREFAAIPASRDEPGEPAQYAVASVRAFRLKTDAEGRATTLREYLETPDWLEDILADAIDVSSLGDFAEEDSL